MPTYKTHCLCGDVEMEIESSVKDIGQMLCQTAHQHVSPLTACHCKNCTLWHGTPIAGSIIYQTSKDDASQPYSPLHVTNQSLIHSYSKTGSVHRHYCSHCGSHLFLTAPEPGLVILQPGAWRFSGLPFEPQAHVNYEQAQVRVPDGLPKYVNFPQAHGGSGELCSE